MKFEGEQTLLRVHLRSTDRAGWSLAADTLLTRALRRRLSGATALEGFFGLDCTGRLLEERWWSLVRRRPVVLEFFDGPRAIGAFLADVAAVVREGLATLERAHVLLHRRRDQTADGGRRFDIPAPPGPFANLPAPEEFPIMKQTTEGQLLRVFIDDGDRLGGEPLYRVIVRKAQELGLAGATVLRAPMGFGAHRRLHSAHFPDYLADLPVVVEIVDATEKIRDFLPFLDEAVPEGLVTIEGVRILRFRRG
jgi:uncharacterized protein